MMKRILACLSALCLLAAPGLAEIEAPAGLDGAERGERAGRGAAGHPRRGAGQVSAADLHRPRDGL